MFKKLRNRLVLINFIITTIIIVVAFLVIYFTARNAALRRPLPPNKLNFHSSHESQMMDERLHDDRESSLKSLAYTLVFVGISIEVFVILASYIFAEIAIRPVRETYESQKNFIANASHEIKTPLAAISANLEAADIKNNKWINNISDEVDSLTRLNQDLLNLAQAERPKDYGEPEEVEILPNLKELVQHFSSRAESKKLKLSLKVEPKDAKLLIQKADFLQLVTILTDNAVKYGQKSVRIVYQPHELKVINDGATISKAELAHIFERFYQVDKSSDGVGLGLSIARALAERNHWQLSAKSENGETCFLLYL